jgi:drug/metabolite transporter (DMT)-like permease
MSFTAPALTLRTALLLLLPPIMWAGNAVVGRLAADWIPPITLNLFRWSLVLLLLLPVAGWVLKPGSPLWRNWKRFALLGLLSVSSYNLLQYMALHTSTPVNVTLVAASMPVWMLLVGRLFFKAPIRRMAVAGAAFSLLGVLVVLTQGQPTRLLQLQVVPGDGLMLVAAFVWALYSWLLTERKEDPTIRNDWAAFLMAQVVMGLVWASAMTAGEWTWLGLTDQARHAVQWSWALVAVIVFVAVGPSIVAYRFWGEGVQAAGPTVAGFFANLTPLFAALLSLVFLGEWPQLFHVLAFVLIVGGIVLSARR